MTGHKVAGAVLLFSVLICTNAKPYDSCPSTKVPTCPAEDPKTAILVPHPTSCDWYFECSNGIAYCMPCPAGEYFNPKLKVCDYPENAGCGTASGSDLGTATGTATGSGSGSGSASASGSGSGSASASGSGSGSASASGSGSGSATASGSGSGSASASGSGSGSASASGSGSGSASASGSGSGSASASGSGSGSATGSGSGSGSGSGGGYACAAATAPKCPAVDSKTPTFYSHPTNPSYYYECSNGIAYCMPCPAGLIFNTDNNVCDYAAGSGSGDGSGSGTGSGDGSGSGTGSGDGSGSGTGSGDGTGSGSGGGYACPAARAPRCPSQDWKMPTFYVHPTNPSYYYECSNGIAYCMPCPAGLVFNTDKNVCDYAAGSGSGDGSGSGTGSGDGSGSGTGSGDGSGSGTGSGDGSGSGSGGGYACPAATAPKCPAVDSKTPTFYSHPTNPSFYYECSNGVAYCMPCPAGLVFNTDNNVCDYAAGSGSGDGSGSGTGSGDGSGSGTGSGDGSGSGTGSGDGSGSGTGSGDGSGSGSGGGYACPAATAPKCPAVDSKTPTFYSHPTNPSFYYECSNGVAFCMPCPAGLVFNTDKNVCDYAAGSGSGDGSGSGTGSGGGSGSGTGSGDGSGSGTGSGDGSGSGTGSGDGSGSGSGGGYACPAATAPKCPAVDSKTPTFFSHPTNPSFYYECSNGVAYCMPCPAGLVFNTDKNVCDYAAGSGSGDGSGSGTGSGDGSGSGTGSGDGSGSGTGSGDGSGSGTGSGDGSGSGSGGGYACPAATAPRCPSKDWKMPTFYVHPTNPSFYYECSNGIAYCMPCPAGLVFNTDNNVCDYAAGSGSGDGSGSGTGSGDGSGSGTGSGDGSGSGTGSGDGSGSGSGGEYACPAARAPRCPSQDWKMPTFYVHPSNPSYYYECSNGIAYCMPCPAGLVFNTDKNVCDYAAGSGSGDGSGSGTGSGDGSGSGTGSGDGSGSGTGSGDGTGSGSGGGYACPAATAPKCPAVDSKNPTYYSHPANPSFYYECSNGVAYCMPCPAGLVFNTDNSVCDYAAGSGSGDGSGSATATGSGSGSATATGSGSGSATATGSGSGSATATGSGSGSATATGTGSGSATATGSGSGSATATGSGSESGSPSAGASACPSGSAPTCPQDDPKMAVLLPHPKSCGWYFECSNGTPYCMPCPAGEYFNPDLKVCDYKEESGCKI